jgi:triacylglycerol lipase
LNKLASLRGSGNRVATEPDTSKTKSATESRTSAATQSSKAEATATPVTTETAATPDPKTLLTDLADGRLGFNARKAYWSAEAALLAYAEKGPVTAAFKLWGLEVPHYFDTVPACQGFLAVSSEKKIAVLAFRGTEKNLEDWRTDAEFALTAKPCIFDGTETHAGFCGEFDKAYPELKEKIAEYVKDDMLLYVTGHSLGAALATLAAARLTVDKVRGVHAVYTFGSPRVGNPAFAKAYDYVLGPRTHRCVNAEDLVTRVPPRIIPGKDWKYDHVGQVVYFDSDGRMHLGVGFWQRFLNTVINAIEDFRKELQTLLKDHSMEGYVRLLKRQINGR